MAANCSERDLAQPRVQTLENNRPSCTAGRSPTSRTAAIRRSPPRAALKASPTTWSPRRASAPTSAPKFIDIKCRKTGLRPSPRCCDRPCAQVPHHGGSTSPSVETSRRSSAACQPRAAPAQRRAGGLQPALRRGSGQPPLTRHRGEIALLTDRGAKPGRAVIGGAPLGRGRRRRRGSGARGGRTARSRRRFQFVYDEALPRGQKVEAIATKIYGAASITASRRFAGARIERLQAEGYGTFRCASPRRR